MATRSDFEQKQRERRRMERERAKRNKTILMVLAGVVVLLFIISIVSCSKKKNNSQNYVPENANNDLIVNETAMPAPAATDAPVFAGVENIPAAEDENDLLEIVENADAQYYAYLTFDDGPTKKITPQILDTLRRYNVKATFFEVGSYIRQNPDMAQRVHEEGHLIASHSDSHDYDKLYSTEESFKKEIESSYDSITDITGEESFRLMRFPGGSYNAGDHASEKQEYKKTLKDMGFYYIDWNTLNGDAEGRTKDADGLLEYLKDNMPSKGDNVVVLMHDASTKQATADALGSIIEYLSEEGYSFHRLDDIPYSKNSSSSSSSATDKSSDDEE